MSLETWSGSRSALDSGRRAIPRAVRRLAISLYLGLLVYCVLSILLGPAGIAAYQRLEERQSAMRANLDELAVLRGRLSADLESLKSDSDRAAREARALGYLRKGETAVILGERAERVDPIDTGRVLPYAEPSSIADAALKRIALGACLAAMALLFAPRGKPGRRLR